MNLYHKIKNGILDTISHFIPSPLSETGEVVSGDSLSNTENLRNTLRPAVLQAWIATYLKTIRTRAEFMNNVEKVKQFYLTDALIRLVADDALTPDITTGEVVQMRSDIPQINEELIKFQKLFDIDRIINDIVVDLLYNGEYFLRLKINDKEGKGVSDIIDDVDQTKVVAMYRHGYPECFIHQESFYMKKSPAYKYIHFAINKHKLRILVNKEYDRKKTPNQDGRKFDDTPMYVRVGRSVLYGVLSKIKELQLLESLVPMTKLNEVLRGQIIGVNIPAATDPKDGFEISKRFEDILNKSIGINKNTDELAVADIVSIAGRIKCLPMFGDKGEMRQLDVRSDSNIEQLQSTIRDNREIICTSMGIPPELLFGGASKGETIKRYARYLRTLKSIQSSIAVALKQLGMIHIVNLDKGYTISPNDVKVTFRNEIIAIDELDKLEYTDAIIGMISNIIRFADDIYRNDDLKDIIDKPQLQAWIRKNIELVSGEFNFIKTSTESKSSPSTDLDADSNVDAKSKLISMMSRFDQ